MMPDATSGRSVFPDRKRSGFYGGVAELVDAQAPDMTKGIGKVIHARIK